MSEYLNDIVHRAVQERSLESLQVYIRIGDTVSDGKWEGFWYNPGDSFSVIARSPSNITKTVVNGKWT
jgi:hypothetical protein